MGTVDIDNILNGFYLFGKNKNTIKLDNGNYIFFNFEDYKSKFNFILKGLNTPVRDMFEKIPFKKRKDLNLDFDAWNNNLEILEGKFFISRKGSPFFDLTTEEKPHLLVKFNWIVSSLSIRKGIKNSQNISKKEIIFSEFNEVSSMAGNGGTDYIVLPIDSNLACEIYDLLIERKNFK